MDTSMLWTGLFLLYLLRSVQCQFTAKEWMTAGEEELSMALNLHYNEGLAKNVILFLGDGMGVSTVTAARIYKGQREGQPGEETQLNFEKFPHVALSKTYNLDKQVPDSAGTSTAFLSGVKTNSGTLGVDARVQRQNCSLLPEAKVSTILDWAMEAGKWAGLVTTTHVTHATPAAGYAHTPERDWESDLDMMGAGQHCLDTVKDIARQLVEDVPNKDIRVVLGGGRKHFTPWVGPNSGSRFDQRNLTQEWLTNKHQHGAKASYVVNKDQLDAVNVTDTDFLLGLFSLGHMEFDLNRNESGTVIEPSLPDMVRKAIGILSKNPEGFFLLVEGGRIDHAHHINKAHLALGDTVAMDDAVAVAQQLTGDDTLLVVSADHSHVFTMGGYPDRGHDILGVLNPEESDRAQDGMPYSTLSYANGPGPARINLTGVDTTSTEFQQSRLVPLNYETHAGEDVAIYATGPMAHLFHGVHEQSYIAHVMAFASCLGPYTHTQRCQKSTTPATESTNPPVTSSSKSTKRPVTSSTGFTSPPTTSSSKSTEPSVTSTLESKSPQITREQCLPSHAERHYLSMFSFNACISVGLFLLWSLI